MNFDLPSHRNLLNLQTSDDIESSSLVCEFMDDSATCADALINGTEVTLFWCGGKVVGALDLTDESNKARRIVFDALTSEICTSINMMFDYGDESEFSENLEQHHEAYEAVLEYIRRQGPQSSIWSEATNPVLSRMIDFNEMELI